ncbi:hypothetical protein NEFER03_0337 [Nematocida sp. LUAm3]|nr:hypothetical protein NEFER03_0337 [Nematocida sp. LUAm3]KAI5173789.1 hypothetical protein NEFER02_0305 [Nematocida sp. LUAm2]KAI5177012.1 hypothetical protein NEFER01_0337 [Nematocida sp. LUAm1]
MLSTIEAILEGLHGGHEETSSFQRLNILNRIQAGGYSFSLKRTECYLRSIRGFPELESPIIKRIFTEIINLDVSLGIERSIIEKSEWNSILEECGRDIACSVELSPISEEDSEDTQDIKEDKNKEVKEKLIILLRAIKQVIEFLKMHMNDKIFISLMEIFEEKILLAQGLLVTPLLLFNELSRNRRYSCNFVNFLSNGIFSGYDTRREHMTVFLCSFLGSLSSVDDSILRVFKNGFLIKAAERIRKEEDRLSSVMVQSLMHLAICWKGSVSTCEIDQAIEQGFHIKVLSKICQKIQKIYKSICPEYKIHKGSDPLSINYPFEASEIPYIHWWLENYRYK